MLFERFAKIDEGDLSRLRANLVKQASLADIAQNWSCRSICDWASELKAVVSAGRPSWPIRSKRCSAPCSLTPASTPRGA